MHIRRWSNRQAAAADDNDLFLQLAYERNPQILYYYDDYYRRIKSSFSLNLFQSMQRSASSLSLSTATHCAHFILWTLLVLWLLLFSSCSSSFAFISGY